MLSFHDFSLEKIIAPSDLLILGGPAGGPGTWKSAWASQTILHDSESLSALKSNMGAGQHRKIDETDYV